MPSSPSPPSPPARATVTSAAAAAAAAAASTPRRRRRILPSPAGGGSSFSSSSSFSFPPTSPSPFHRFLPSPLRASSVPFSWEHRPGIPKTPARSRSSSKQAGGGKSAAAPLPLPPSLLSRASDPYASAVVPAEYAGAMPPPPPMDYMGKARRVSRRSGGGGRLRLRRRQRLAVDALAEWLSVLSLNRSCKRAAACFAAKAKTKPPPAP